MSIIDQVQVPWPFLTISCFFCGFLSSLTSSFIICGDFIVHVDTDCTKPKTNFLNVLDASNLVKSVKKPTHLHILDLILSPSGSTFSW